MAITITANNSTAKKKDGSDQPKSPKPKPAANLSTATKNNQNTWTASTQPIQMWSGERSDYFNLQQIYILITYFSTFIYIDIVMKETTPLLN